MASRYSEDEERYPAGVEWVPLCDFLRPGDVLLYKATGLFGWIISVKTWHDIAHVEVYVGDWLSVASREGQGVGRYGVRTRDLVKICRPIGPYDMAKALAWFESLPPIPYGWLDLLAFVGLPMDGAGIVCSPFATDFLRVAGLNPFNGEPSRLIAPFQFDVSPMFDDYVVRENEVEVPL